MPGSTISDARVIYNLTDCSALATTSANVLWNYRTSALYRINSIRFTNLNAGTINLNVNLFDYSNNTIVRLANAMPISGKTTNVFSNINSTIILEPGDVLAANCSANNSINIIIQYDVYADITEQTLISSFVILSNNGSII